MTNSVDDSPVTPVITAPHVTHARISGLFQGAAAALALLVAAVHVIDQGGLIGDKSPSYVAVGYWVLEVVAIVLAVALFASPKRMWWLVAFGVGLGPMVGYILSRGPGLPDYTDDRGNWGEPLGVISLVAEGLLVVVAIAGAVVSMRRAART